MAQNELPPNDTHLAAEDGMSGSDLEIIEGNTFDNDLSRPEATEFVLFSNDPAHLVKLGRAMRSLGGFNRGGPAAAL